MHYLYYKHLRENTNESAEALKEEIDEREELDAIFTDFDNLLGLNNATPATPTNFECLRDVMETYEAECGKFSEYGLKKIRSMVNACESNTDRGTVKRVIHKLCSDKSLRLDFD